jgi:hypothetical protein
MGQTAIGPKSGISEGFWHRLRTDSGATKAGQSEIHFNLIMDAMGAGERHVAPPAGQRLIRASNALY